MGFNTGVIILNDALPDIERNANEFVINLGQLVRRGLNPHERGDISCGYHGNAAAVFHMEHADVTGVYALGGNHASMMGAIHNGGKHHTEEEKLRLLKMMAEEMGYSLVKRKKK